MFMRGYAKHLCTRLTRIRGFAVRPIRPYRCGRPYTQGVPFYTLVVGSIESQGIE